MIGVTGSEGLIGRNLCASLARFGLETRRLDLRLGSDVRNFEQVASFVDRCTGIVHLAAVSRVAQAERNPAECFETNVGGTKNVLQAAMSAKRPPWVLFASSREVYGECGEALVREDAPLRPMNAYSRAKVAGEELVRGADLMTATVRLSNVYGDPVDHEDRVVPAFVKAAARSLPLRVEGDGVFDFTHVDDVVAGLIRTVAMLQLGIRQPTVHFVTGRGTSLKGLARLAMSCCDSKSSIVAAPPRTFDVARFVGDPSLATDFGWIPKTSIEDGVARLFKQTA